MTDCKFKNVWVDMSNENNASIRELFDMCVKAGADIDDKVSDWTDCKNTYNFMGIDGQGETYSLSSVTGSIIPFSEIETYLGLKPPQDVPIFTWNDYDNKVAPPVGSEVICGKCAWGLYKNIVEVVTPPLETVNTVCIVKYWGKYYDVEHSYLTPSTPRKSIREQKEDYLRNYFNMSDSIDVVELLDGLDNIK